MGQISHDLLIGDGIFAPLFSGYNVTHAMYPELYPELDAVYSLNPAALIAVSSIVLLALILSIQLLRIAIGLIRFLILLVRAPPLYWLYSG
jgi:hypothetical protein